MRLILLAALAVTLGGGSVFARTSAKQATSQAGRPVDNGPVTPGANNAYQGGGVVLQGAPGAPAPQPQATPPGQPPQNAVTK
jgi:hypothetical protein